jgi:hypothetical protein
VVVPGGARGGAPAARHRRGVWGGAGSGVGGKARVEIE